MKPISPNRIAEGQAKVRARLAGQAPRVINHEAVLQLGQPIPLVYRGGRYVVAALSHRDAIELQRSELRLKHWATNPAQTEDELDDQAAELVEMLALYHSLLDPMPESNPFADASPLEVGELLRFFFMCLMMQNSRSPLVDGPSSTLTH